MGFVKVVFKIICLFKGFLIIILKLYFLFCFNFFGKLILIVGGFFFEIN